MRYDLVIVGAGPAGGTAAAKAAQAGMRVALVERHTMPRHKTCGGGVPVSVTRLLAGLDLARHADCTIRFMRHTYRFDHACLAPIAPHGAEHASGLVCVRREVFDTALADFAARHGADVLDGLTVDSLDSTGDGIRISAHTHVGTPWQADASYVIGADGANGIVGRLAGLRPPRAEAIGMEVLVPHEWDAFHPFLRPDVIHLEYGVVRHGYAWVFPNREQLNIGAGFMRDTANARGHRLRETLADAIRAFARYLGVAPDCDNVRFLAHPLPVWSGAGKRHGMGGRVLLVGDAAALVNPLFGDGILNAVRSSILAVRCIVENRSSSYSNELHATIGREMTAAARVAAIFYHLPHECFRYAVTRPNATAIAAQLLNGELPYRELAPRAIRRLTRAIAGA